MKESDLFGLVMTGGGARGAYQAGVLKKISEWYPGAPSPFQVVAGASAGAINGIMAAAGAGDFVGGMKTLNELWANIQAKQVFRTDVGSIGSKASQWVTDLTFGGMIGGGRAQSLLDARPLREFLSKNIPFSKIQENINSGVLKAVCAVATNYTNGKSFIFIQGYKGHPLWKKSRRVALSVDLTAEHILAWAAIPVVFQRIPLQTELGHFYFGDGCLRMTTPLSPAIRLGANKLLAIGVRSEAAAQMRDAQIPSTQSVEDHKSAPPLAQVVGVMMNAIFLDHLDADVEHLRRLNEIIEAQKQEKILQRSTSEPMKRLDVFSIAPSVDLGELASHHAKDIPTLVRYMMRGLGTKESESADLMSYLLFSPKYTQALIDIGYHDAEKRSHEIKDFLNI